MNPDRTRRAFAIVLAALLAVGVLLPATALAGDNATSFYFDDDEIAAEPGETVELELIASDHGDLHGNGIDELEATLAYESDLFEVVDVEHGSMLAAGDSDAEVEGSSSVDEGTGTVTIEQERTPSGDGATASDVAATITLAVAEDAEATSETIEIADASTTLVTDYPQASFEYDATIHVAGGDGDVADDEADDAETDGVTLADDVEESNGDDTDADDDSTVDSGDTAGADENGTADDAADDAESSGDADSVPGFAVPAAVAGLTLTIALLVARRRV
ncbi:cohesin domain-containing protein [Natronococcus sp. A-GB1]|uniref:cohesin domain-containing protein n=1 Tax=Natronococcus sp. A-GB1 TaxID=3037648 RepID=UPI00241FD823|nr:cohesin domain-containing protein [Natronococcus sp. A-GB1]MDG5759413.1 cohesin domain-containing protein [Natronococcus sp. A-GB1]